MIPVEPRVRLVRLGYLVTSLAPLPAAVAAMSGAGQPVLLCGVAAVISCSYLLQYRAYRVLNRYLALSRLLWELVITGLGIAAAAMAGGWLVEAWRDHPGLAGGEFWQALAIVVLLQVVSPLAYAKQLGLVVTLLAGPVRLLADKGYFLFWTAGLLHPDAGLLRLAGWLALLQLPLSWMMARESAAPHWAARVNDAHVLIDAPREHRERIVGAWLSDSVLRRGGPDLSFVHTLLDQAQQSVVRTENIVLRLMGLDATASRPGETALEWIDTAAGLLEEARRALGPDGARPAAGRALDLAEAHAAQARAEIRFVLGRREEALASWRRTFELWTRHGLHDLRAHHLITLTGGRSDGQSMQVMGPEDAITELERLIDAPELTQLSRRHAMLASSACHAELDRPDRAAELAAAGRRIRVRRADMRTHIRQSTAAGRRPTAMHAQRQWDLAMVLATSTVIVHDAYGPTQVLFLGTRFWPESRAKELIVAGMRLWRAGRPDAAETALREAAGLLRSTGQTTFAYWVMLQLGRAQYAPAPARAYRSLTDALDLRELLRDQVLDARLRMAAGGSAEGLYAAIVRLLVGDGPGADAGADGWPPGRATAAFELVERGRSRSMLELLGENLPAHVGPEHTELVTAEEAARRRLADCRAAVGTGAPGEEAVIRLRTARGELREVLDSLAATGERGAEYAQLRRGAPRSYDEIRRMLEAL
ncbi:hypothetical protein [Nonomuraea sp. NPDC049607]|uniref:hypothetical protein n=1 Tax=Nonomuraea sp. NPDC049607 TaxID=3154732 RepID=UPI0034140347